ncbi:retrovirus-related pol polyprotein from transposon TNT 1-94 [Tanacetum coccineum]
MVSTTRCLELLHMDLFGPSVIRSYERNRYTLVIVDDYSRKIKEALNVTFDETPPPSKISPLLDDDLDEEESIKVTEKKNLENDIKDETLEIDKIVNIKESRNYPLENVIGNLNQRILRSQAQNQSNFFCFISTIEPKNMNEALADESWIVAMEEELNQFIANDGIDYDKTYAPVARLESIRILLAYACALDFKVFQMDVKSAFLNGFINEEVYIAQPSRFIDFKKPDHVYKLKKALYGLKQEPKAWYDRLKAFLIKHEYKMGMVDNTLFTKKKGSNLIIVQIYIDDIIFDSTCQDTCDEFTKIMHDEFEMSMMGELNFFIGLQIKQMEDGIFFNQSKYIKEMLKKFSLEDSKPMKTPMSSDTKLTKAKECESVDSTKYRGIIDDPYQTNPPSPDDIISYIRIDREGQVTHIRYVEKIDVHDHQILTREIVATLKPLEEIIWENDFCLGGNQDHVPACLCYMLYYVANSEKFNLAYFMAKRMEWVTKQSRRGRHSTSSSSTFDQPSSSLLNDDDDGTDEGTSRASTSSPIHYVNSLTNEVPQVFQNPPNIDPNMEPFYTHQIEIINRQVQLRDEHRGGLRSIEKGFKNLWRNLKKK